MKQEFVQVPVELVRELKRKVVHCHGVFTPALRSSESVASLLCAIDQLPDPPKPDVVEECAKAWNREVPFGTASTRIAIERMRAAIRRYRELMGMDRDPELDE